MSEFGPPVFATGSRYGVHLARCEPCMYGQHVGGDHPWAGAEDLEHAVKTGGDCTGVCGCPCVIEPSRVNEPGTFEPDMDEELTIGPCPECGEVGPCGYDAEGRPLIHALTDDEDTDGA